MLFSLLGCLLVKSWNVSGSTLERTWAITFSDVKIPAINRFSKCEISEGLNKMLDIGNIKAGHDLREENLGKLQHGKVDENILFLSTTIFSIIRFLIEILFVTYILKAKAYARQLFIGHYKDFRRERQFFNLEKQKSRNPTEELFFFEINGMDQAKTLLPHYVNAPKNIYQELLFNFHVNDVK
jgi:hypothetical protein